jgi:hypothetical protein
MKYRISKGERVLVSWLIVNLPGVNRTDGRLVTKIGDHLDLHEVAVPVPFEDAKSVSDYELSELEVQWILDHIEKAFNKQEVPSNLATHAFSLEDTIKPEEKLDKKSKKKSKAAEIPPEELLDEEPIPVPEE